MARYPDIQERLFEEISEVLANNNNEFTFDALNDMKYLDCCMHEVLRIRPVALNLNKLSTKPYTMPLLPGQKEPLVIEKGTPILIPVFSFHM